MLDGQVSMRFADLYCEARLAHGANGGCEGHVFIDLYSGAPLVSLNGMDFYGVLGQGVGRGKVQLEDRNSSM